MEIKILLVSFLKREKKTANYWVQLIENNSLGTIYFFLGFLFDFLVATGLEVCPVNKKRTTLSITFNHMKKINSLKHFNTCTATSFEFCQALFHLQDFSCKTLDLTWGTLELLLQNTNFISENIVNMVYFCYLWIFFLLQAACLVTYVRQSVDPDVLRYIFPLTEACLIGAMQYLLHHFPSSTPFSAHFLSCCRWEQRSKPRWERCNHTKT